MIKICNLSKSFDNACPVIRNINFEVDAGEFVVILGQSGAGKSTLLRCLNFLSAPTAGQIFIHGQHYCPEKKKHRSLLREQVGMVFQNHNLISRISVLKNVLVGCMSRVPLGLSLLHLFPKAEVDAAHDALAQVGLADKADSRAGVLSGGEQQRVGIARALLQRPSLILADEPVASLDPKAAQQVLRCLRGACLDNGIAVICNLHQVDYALTFATRIIGLAKGRIVFDGSPAQLTPEVVSAIYSSGSRIRLAEPGLDISVASQLKREQVVQAA